MPDFFDQAQELEILQRENALARTLDQAQCSGISATHCSMPDCCDPIPEARQKAVPGVRFCVACQERLERYPSLRKFYE